MLILNPPFWRQELLAESELKLIAEFVEAHDLSAIRPNASSGAVLNSYAGSHNYNSAIAAALLTLGGPHAPIRTIYDFLENENAPEEAARLIESGLKVPGWGNAFVKGEPDPDWRQVDAVLKEYFSDIHGRLCAVTKALHSNGKRLFPNPGAYTAAAALVLGCPREVAGFLFVASRLSAWSRCILLFHQQKEGR